MTISEEKQNSPTSADSLSAQELENLDRQFLVHPHQRADLPARCVVVRGSGSTVWDAEGNELLDAMGGGNWLAHVGHARPELAAAAAEQLGTLEYFTGFHEFANDKSVRLAARLAELAPEGIDRVFFTNGGSEAVETAIKAARLFHFKNGDTDRTWIIARKFGYHGCTYGSGTATGFEGMQFGVGPMLPHVEQVSPPYPYHSEFYGGMDVTDALVQELEATIERIGPGNIAAMIGEPIMGGGGVVTPPADYWPRIREVLSRHGILLVADEVVTAFGRTGSWFASETLGMQADMIVTAKGITSGYAPLGAVLMRSEVADVITTGEMGFFHGYTYSGHPTSCAVALANLDLITEEKLPERALQIGAWLDEALDGARSLPAVGDIRVAGAMVGVELVADKEQRIPQAPPVAAAVVDAMRHDHNVVVSDYGPTVVLAPPLVLTEDEARRAAAALTEVLSRLSPDGTIAPR